MKQYMRIPRARLFALAVLPVFLMSGPALAQETRADVIQQEQAAKQERLAPERPSGVQRLVMRLERWGLVTSAPDGFYPWVGSVYSGGGYAFGGGVRKPFADDAAFNVMAGYSARGYAVGQAELALPSFASRRGRATLSGRAIHAPNVHYFGVGNASSKDDETQFGYEPITGGARVDLQLTRPLSVGAGVEYNHTTASAGRVGPSIEERFSPLDTPGLEQSNYSYARTTARAAYDWRRPLGYSGRGGLYRVQFDQYRERDSRYSFNAVEAEAIQLVPIRRANWVIALRGLTTLTDLDDADGVPFFLMPTLGGGSTLRGYPDFRFRDRDRLLITGELRWTPARFLDMAIFYDTGKVAARRQDLNFTDMKSSYGVGMRLIGLNGYAFRVEAARSREHNLRLIVSAGGAF